MKRGDVAAAFTGIFFYYFPLLIEENGIRLACFRWPHPLFRRNRRDQMNWTKIDVYAVRKRR